MAMTLQQFGQTIKQQYPQYNDLDDEELGQKILKKYPQYQDMVDVGPQPNLAQKADSTTVSAADKLATFFYPETTKLAKGVATGSLDRTRPDAAEQMAERERLAQLPVGERLKQSGVLNPLKVGKEFAQETIPFVPADKNASEEQKQIKRAVNELSADYLMGKAFSVLGGPAKKVLGKLTQELGETGMAKSLKGAVKGAKRMMASQILQPAQGEISKGISRGYGDDAVRTGVNETLEYIANKNIELNPKKMFQRSATQLSSLSDDIGKLSKKMTNEGITVNFDDITAALDDEIAQATRLQDANTIKKLTEMKGKFSGEKTFEEAYQLLKDFGDQSRKAYEQGKTPSGVKELETRAYQLMNNEGRAKLKEIASNAGYDTWAEMADDYHNWKTLESWSQEALAKGQGKIGSLTNVIWSRMLPALISGGPVTRGLIGGTVGATTNRDNRVGGFIGGAAAGATIPPLYRNIATPGVKSAVSNVASKLAPKTTRRVLQDYFMPQEEEENL